MDNVNDLLSLPLQEVQALPYADILAAIRQSNDERKNWNATVFLFHNLRYRASQGEAITEEMIASMLGQKPERIPFDGGEHLVFAGPEGMFRIVADFSDGRLMSFGTMA